ncbi:MAG: hypothetical protein IT453_19955 [Planctomycetes bacterium]|nr:hypothetical protein [Planctomycetota bacterium]
MKLKIAITLLGAVLSTALALPSYAQEAKPAGARQVQDGQGGEKKREQGGEKREKKEGDEAKREEQKGGATDEQRIAHQMPLYPLDTCVVSGEPLGADAKSFIVEGRLVRTCCGRCEAKVKGDAKDALKKLDEAIVRKQKALYPMEKCPISGEKLGEGAVDVVHNSRLVRFCCEKCVVEFKKDPESSLKKLDTAYIASQKKSYPIATCLVMGDETLGDDAIDHLYGNRLVRFCCKKCIKEFRSSPDKYLAKLDEAAAKKKN